MEIYNTILSFMSLIELSDIVLPFSNDSVSSMSDDSISCSKYYNFHDINSITA